MHVLRIYAVVRRLYNQIIRHHQTKAYMYDVVLSSDHQLFPIFLEEIQNCFRFRHDGYRLTVF